MKREEVKELDDVRPSPGSAEIQTLSTSVSSSRKRTWNYLPCRDVVRIKRRIWMEDFCKPQGIKGK